ncbi:MAG: ATP-dependent RecD-like DNA helicase [Candidatus Aminicenantes bacterium]
MNNSSGLTGTIESIVFYSPDSGYTVCRFSLEEGRNITIVGNFPPLTPGEVLKVEGKWEINPRFGQQLRVQNYKPVLPSSGQGVEKFLSSGLINGIGPVLAKRIIAHFKEETLVVLSENPERLRQVEGVGSKKLDEIKKSWSRHEDIRELIIFLQQHGVSTNLATKIYRQYGRRAFHILKTNPYQACHDIWGVGFKTADQMALKLGMEPDSPERVKAYIHYLLEKDTEEGHVFSRRSHLEESCGRDLNLKKNAFSQALDTLEKQKFVIMEDLGNDQAVYLPFFHQAEQDVVRNIYNLAGHPPLNPPEDVNAAVKKTERASGISFSEDQRRAVKESILSKFLVITGGPGTGKTTIIRSVVHLFSQWGRTIILAAPTGRAAKRLSEATGREAKTLHRTLEYMSRTGKFRRNENHPLEGDALIVDEVSMVDLPLMHHLLKAVPPSMRVILVGDKDQLPSVGPGTMLQDIIQSGRVEVVRLSTIFRQEKGSLIVKNAHRINQGQTIIQPEKDDKNSDFYFLALNDERKVFDMIMKLSQERIPKKLRVPPLSPQIQVISPMYRGLAGVDNLNKELQNRLNPGPEGLMAGSREFREGDKVMQVRNNYDKDVFNGDIGIIKEIDRRIYRIAVDFDGQILSYSREEMNELVLAYAISVHKSQGSEYQAVVMPLLTQHYIMLQRNLLYTALTRAKKLSCIIGSYKALHIAINNNKPVLRNGLVKEKLRRLPPFHRRETQNQI